MTRSSVAERLAENAKSREFRTQSYFEGAFGDYGTFAMLELDDSHDSAERKNRLRLMSNLLDILDPELVKNSLQKSIKLVNSEGEKTKKRDKFLKGMIEAVAGENLSEEDKKGVYKCFYYLVHNVYFDKRDQVPISGLISRISENILLYDGDRPTYPNAYAENGDAVVDEVALRKEIRQNLAQRITQEKEKLRKKFIALGGSEKEFEAGKIIGKRVSFDTLVDVAEKAKKTHAETDEVVAILVSLFEQRAKGLPKIGPEIPAANPSDAALVGKLPRGNGRGAGA